MRNEIMASFRDLLYVRNVGPVEKRQIALRAQSCILLLGFALRDVTSVRVAFSRSESTRSSPHTSRST